MDNRQETMAGAAVRSRQVRPRARKKKRAALILLGVLIFLIGAALLAYPAVSQWLSGQGQSSVIADYAERMDELDGDEAEQELQRARQYNHNLTESVSVADPFQQQNVVDTTDYPSLLNFTADGVMGYVEIPKINVLLPIYHGVEKSILASGIGHLPETSLPVGGESTHAVLCGHSGMSNARLFTDLPKLEVGDVFYIHIYNQKLTYTVDQVKKVIPTDTRDLNVTPGADYVTLVTCVPIAVNSHRLLVRGTRTEPPE